jgi:hypothetical protein
MKKQNQIGRNSKAEAPVAQPKPSTERRVRARVPMPAAGLEIPESWEEVAMIDFTGYLDRDCEERIIYKTPEGTLKASRASDNEQPTVIEDVTREQVLRWIHECLIPEEFEADFRPQIANQNSLSDGVSRRDAVAARDALDNATFRSAALLEALATLLEFSEKADHPQLSDSTVEGLRFIAFKESVNLRGSFDNYSKQLGAKGGAITA